MMCVSIKRHIVIKPPQNATPRLTHAHLFVLGNSGSNLGSLLCECLKLRCRGYSDILNPFKMLTFHGDFHSGEEREVPRSDLVNKAVGEGSLIFLCICLSVEWHSATSFTIYIIILCRHSGKGTSRALLKIAGKMG